MDEQDRASLHHGRNTYIAKEFPPRFAQCRSTAGPMLLRDWIARAALRDPEKPWIVCADDGRTVSYRALQRRHRPHRSVPARPRHRQQRPGGAARQQLDRASALLFRRHGLRRHHLHRSRRDEPQPARQHLRAARADARAASGRTGARRPPGRRFSAAHAARTLATSPTTEHSCRGRAPRSRAMRGPQPGRTTTQ